MSVNRASMLFLALITYLPVHAAQRCQTENVIATAPSSRYQQNTDGTVLDTDTNLMWRVCVEGVTGKACNAGEPLQLNWAAALQHVAALDAREGFASYKDWRLPNIRELITLAELQCVDPAINTAVFVNAGPLQVWSSSPQQFIDDYAWFVDFASGVFTYDQRIKPKAVRLVRDAVAGQAGASP